MSEGEGLLVELLVECALVSHGVLVQVSQGLQQTLHREARKGNTTLVTCTQKGVQ